MEDEQVFLHFKSLSKEKLIKLFLLLDDDFEYLKKIIQNKIENLLE